MKKFLTVFWFHFKDTVTGKVALICMALLFLGVFGFFGVREFFDFGGSPEAARVVVIQNSESFAFDGGALPNTETVHFELRGPSSLETARTELENGDIDTILIVEGMVAPELHSISYGAVNMEGQMLVAQLLQQKNLERVMAAEGISPEVAGRLLAPVVSSHESLVDEVFAFQAFMINYVYSMALYTILATTGGMIAMAILNEKTSRVMEVMISKVKPSIMMYAKIFAVLGTVLTIALTAVLGYMAAWLLGWAQMEGFSLFGMTVLFDDLGLEVLLLALAYFIMGYFLFGMLYALVGALCSKQEDYQSMAMPVMVVLMVPFFMAMNPNQGTLLATITSYIPFFSPFIMFARFTSGYATLFEAVLGLAITAVFIGVLGKVATKLYCNGVMHYSEKASLKDIKKLLKG